MFTHPPFCPNNNCINHQRSDSRRIPIKRRRWYQARGKYRTKIFGEVSRYRCKSCKREFSAQTFSIDYYAKKQVSYRRIEEGIKNTSGIRDLARDLGVHDATIQNKISRLARNALAAHGKIMGEHGLAEAIVVDGFETFIGTQYSPCHINLLAGKDSQYLYAFNYAPLRRKGRMSDSQRKRRELLEKVWRPDPKALERSFSILLSEAMFLQSRKRGLTLSLWTDEHPAYKKALAGNDEVRKMIIENKFIHSTISSRKARVFSNPLFAVNYLDRQIRKDRKDHVRQTVCFARNTNNAMERLAIYRCVHNFFKPYRERQKKGDITTHASKAGIDVRMINGTFSGYYSRRSFYSRGTLISEDKKIWKRDYLTPYRKEKANALPAFALG